MLMGTAFMIFIDFYYDYRDYRMDPSKPLNLFTFIKTVCLFFVVIALIYIYWVNKDLIDIENDQ